MLAAEAVIDSAERVELDLGWQHTRFQLVYSKTPFLMESTGHLSHRVRCANITPTVECLVTASPLVHNPLVREYYRMVSGIAKEEIRSELDFLSYRASQQLAYRTAGCLAHRVETSQFNAGVHRCS